MGKMGEMGKMGTMGALEKARLSARRRGRGIGLAALGKTRAGHAFTQAAVMEKGTLHRLQVAVQEEIGPCRLISGIRPCCLLKFPAGAGGGGGNRTRE